MVKLQLRRKKENRHNGKMKKVMSGTEIVFYSILRLQRIQEKLTNFFTQKMVLCVFEKIKLQKSKLKVYSDNFSSRSVCWVVFLIPYFLYTIKLYNSSLDQSPNLAAQNCLLRGKVRKTRRNFCGSFHRFWEGQTMKSSSLTREKMCYQSLYKERSAKCTQGRGQTDMHIIVFFSTYSMSYTFYFTEPMFTSITLL